MAVATTAVVHTVVAAEPGGELVSSTFEGSSSLTLSNGTLELTFLPQGASIASVVLIDDSEKMNPLWNPVRMNRQQGRAAKPSSMTGHMLCVDGFGPPSADERNAGLPFNGEALSQRFDVQSSKSGSTAEVTLSAKLPIVQEEVTRKLRMVDGENVVYLESQLENLMGFDRPINWGEHATIGSPFLEPGVTVVDLSGGRSETTDYANAPPGGATNASVQHRLASGKEFQWPIAPGLEADSVDMRQTPQNPHYVDHTGTQMDPARKLEWATALNPKRKLILGYIFRREDFPWVQTWGNYPSATGMARGLEFATQAFSLSRRDAITQGSMFDTPMYRWLPAKSKITTKFLMFYARAPDGFAKVDDVRLENGQIVLEDRTAQKKIRLAASRNLD
jgi:hypothetical protein